MATMFPRTLLAEDCQSYAERKVFDALRDGLDDAWEVYHSVSLIVRDHATGATDDETDFVLCHPDEGIVALEVKGGGIECRHGEWYRPRRGGPSERIEDPFRQALDHRYNLKRKLEAALGTGLDGTLLVHALAFPDISAHALVLAPDAPAEILLDGSSMSDVAGAVQRVLSYNRGSRERRTGPGPDRAAAIRDVLAPRIEIPVTWGNEFLGEQQRMIELTSEQSRLLRRVRRNPRMIVSGCAGSGKTMIAIEQAKRFAREGRRTLFVCFNKGLNEHVADQLHGVDGVDAYTFHAFCTHLANRARIRLPTYASRGKPPQEHFDEVLPEALLEATEKLGAQYDAIIADEVQDFQTDWLDALTLTLNDEERDPIWLFLDANQRIFDAEFEPPAGYSTFDLTVNCRNTKSIHDAVMKFYEGDVEPEASGVAGRPPESVTTTNQADALGEVLDRLCDVEEIPPQDIVVLSPHAWYGSKVRKGYRGQTPLLPPWGDAREPAGPFSSIRGFKGLEASVVILCEIEDLVHEPTEREQMYVALSRARHHLVKLVPEELSEKAGGAANASAPP